jgi:hypothetical protein
MKTEFLVVLCAATLAVTGCSKKSASTSASTDMMPTSSTDMMEVTDPELTKQLSDSFTLAGAALKSISDVESAQKAVPELEKISSDVDQIQKQAADLPAATQSSLSEMVAAQLPPLKSAMDTAYGIPGVKDVIQPQMDSLLAKYAGF